MKTIDINKTNAKLIFEFENLKALKYNIDNVIFNGNDDITLIITSYTDFVIQRLNTKSFKSFEKLFLEFNQEKPKFRDYVYENNVMKFEAIRCVETDLMYPTMSWGEDCDDGGIQVRASMIKIHIKNYKNFIKKYETRIVLSRNIKFD